MIHEQRFRNWLGFQKFLRDYAHQPKQRRDSLIFRGHADAGWPLATTLDRHKEFANDRDRDSFYQALVAEFQLEVLRSPGRADGLPSPGDALDLLARHHGLPSPILDWSSSPYVASYFAFDEKPAGEGVRDAAIWVLDRSRLGLAAERVEVIDSPMLLRYNPRALKQQGVFTRIRGISPPLTASLDTALTRLILPSSSRELALAELDAMSINAATLFGDLDAAARTAVYRVDT